MTRSTYVPLNDPPTLWDRVLIHTMEMAISVIMFVSGAKLILFVLGAARTEARGGPDRLHGMPPLVLALIGAVLILGAVLTLVALNWRALHDMGRGWALERFGWSLVIAGMLSYTICVLSYFPDGIVDIPKFLLISLAAVIRIFALRKIEARVRVVKHKIDGGAS